MFFCGCDLLLPDNLSKVKPFRHNSHHIVVNISTLNADADADADDVVLRCCLFEK